MKISFLHTSKLHIERFDKIIRKFHPSIKVEHYVNEALLEVAQKTGIPNKVSFDNEINQIQKNKPDLIICTCSTYGELCDKKDFVYRIDEPIGEYIISNYSKIGIAYTLNSTREISRKLIEKLAHANQKFVQIEEINCGNCWKWFEDGRFEKYDRCIANKIKNKSNNIDVVFLAQASMEGAKKHFTNEIYEVVSSPEFGVRKHLESIKNNEYRTLL